MPGSLSHKPWWRNIAIIARREFLGYFNTPLAFVFVVIFVALTGYLAFYRGNFFARGQADLVPFFMYHPWLYLLLVPAIAMRLWAEERKTGTIELLMTLPIEPWEAIVGKFLAAWAFLGVALALTFPMWITVNVLGRPDNGVILTSYLGSFLMAGAFLAIGSCISALSKSQVIAFIVAATLSYLFVMAGQEDVLNFFRSWAPQGLVNAISNLSFLTHFEQISRGQITLPDVIYYLSMIAFFLFANTLLIDRKKAS